jgi:hypothetical protein
MAFLKAERASLMRTMYEYVCKVVASALGSGEAGGGAAFVLDPRDRGARAPCWEWREIVRGSMQRGRVCRAG